MANRTQALDTVAGAIGDPVKRLKFLQSVAPRVVGGNRRRWSVAIRAILCLIAAAAGVSLVLMRASARVSTGAPAPRFTRVDPKPLPPAAVWRVARNGAFEEYSNGLRIDESYAVPNRPRLLSVPAGIVFHGTESPQAPFEAEQNEALKRIGESLLDYIRRRRSYHFLVDRFGRVYRVVAEADAANHAGHSVWADERGRYVSLNESFLGVAFEARTAGAEAEPEMTAAQVRSGAMLVEMLRSAHRIPAAGCVTHAQVSVNPSNMRVGYHVDWAAGFPFAEMGLPNNYAIPLPAVFAFGFEADAAFREAAGEALRRAVEIAGETLRQRAAAAGVRPAAYRARLQQQYRREAAPFYSAVPTATSGRKKNTIPNIR